MPVSQRVTQTAGDVAQQAGVRAIQALSGGIIPAKWANRALGHLREHKKRYGLLLLAAIPGSMLATFLALGMAIILLFNITLSNGLSPNTPLAGNLSTSVMGLTPTQVQLLNAGADWTAQHRGQAVDGVTVHVSLPAAFLLADLLQESGGQQVPSATSPINWSQFASCPGDQAPGQFRCAQGGTSAMLASAQATIPTGGACQSLSWWQAHGVDCGGAAGPAQIQMTNSSSGTGSDTWASDVAHSALFKAIYGFMRGQVNSYSWPRTPNPWAFGYAVAAQITVLLGKEQAAVTGLGAGACSSSAQETLPSSQCLEWVAAYYNGSESSAGINPGSYGYDVGQLYAGLQAYTQKASVNLQVASSIVESAAQQTVLASAQAQIGVPYVWGGDTPGKAFDCSGLTQYIYSLVGVTLPHNAALQQQMAQQDGVFTPSPNPSGPLSPAQLTQFEAQLAPGDLIFYDVPSDGSQQPGHVGVYVGGGEMIDAPATGQLVSLQPIFNNAAGWPTGGAAFWKLASSAQ